MAEKTFRQYVDEIAEEMVRQLEAHAEEKSGPGAWLDGDPQRWMSEARHQMNGLDAEMAEGTPVSVKARAAHVCNFVMMAMQTYMRPFHEAGYPECGGATEGSDV